MVIGRNDCHATVARDSPCDLLPTRAVPWIGHDLRSPGMRVCDLDGGRILRHHDDRLRCHHSGRGCNTLRMVAGGVGDDTTFPGIVTEIDDAVERTPELEGTGDLQALRLDEEATAEMFVEKR